MWSRRRPVSGRTPEDGRGGVRAGAREAESVDEVGRQVLELRGRGDERTTEGRRVWDEGGRRRRRRRREIGRRAELEGKPQADGIMPIEAWPSQAVAGRRPGC